MGGFRLVIIGGSGDLSLRKLIPSLYACDVEGHLGEGTIPVSYTHLTLPTSG